MMDGKTIRDKLVGSEEERAVSPVIGVILMVAITVILAAVIATLVMDFGDSTSQPVNAVVESEVTNQDASTTPAVRLEVTDAGNAESFEIRGDTEALSGDSELDITSTGDVQTITNSSSDDTLFDASEDGEYSFSIVGIEGDSETIVDTFDIELKDI